MRNWNFNFSAASKDILLSFYITYEELKHFFKICFFCYHESFYITYEELKLFQDNHILDNHIFFLHYLWGIETLLYICFLKRLDTFLHYLWGIETFMNPASFKNCRLFTLPMRNWNYSRIIISWISWITFYITYEELKQSVVLLHVADIICFLHYLWGIETQLSDINRLII